jgi:hypothetical protein
MLGAHLKTLCTQQAIRVAACARLTSAMLGEVPLRATAVRCIPSIVGQQAVGTADMAYRRMIAQKCKQSANMPHAIPRHRQIGPKSNPQQ